MKDPENRTRKVGAESYIKSNNKQQILGPEGSMSEVGNPPPHNSNKPDGLLASINSTLTQTLVIIFRPQYLNLTIKYI